MGQGGRSGSLEPPGDGLELSRATMARLPFYYRTLRHMKARGARTVSSSELAEEIGVDPTQVRKDVASLGYVGKSGVGYSVDDMISILEQALGLNNTTEAVLVGAGHLGTAICRYPGFSSYGLRVVAAFDTDHSKIGTSLGDVKVFPLSELGHIVRRLAVKMGIITVPASCAQAVADLLVENGIKAIWNFAPISLRVPGDVMVRDEDMAAGLSTLSRFLAYGKKAKDSNAISKAGS